MSRSARAAACRGHELPNDRNPTMDINLKTLIGKLNDTTRAAATRAAGICVGFGQYEVDIEHLFLALLEQPASDFVVAARAAGISLTAFETDLRKEVERLQAGS